MVNPGSFPGSRGEFILAQTELYAEAIKDSHVGDTLADIQRRFFKRYPVTLDDSEEPSEEWLAQVDDDAPDPELIAPNIEGMDTAAAEQALAAHSNLITRTKFKKEQIKRRLHYIYSKNKAAASDFDKAAKDPIANITSKLLGVELKLPRRRTAYNVWGPKNRAQVDPVFEMRVEELGAKKDQHAAIRSAVYKELFEALSSDIQQKWITIAEREHEQAVAEVKKRFKESVSSSPEDQQRVIAALPKFIEPILDAVAEYTGWKATFIAGGPEPADGGRLNMISIHSGLTVGPVKMDFGRAQKAAYKSHIAPAFGAFLKKCYTVQDCRASALPKNHSSISISDIAGNEDVAMQIHTFESDAEHESMHKRRLFEEIAKSGKSTKGTKPPTGTPSPLVRFGPPIGKKKSRIPPVKDSALVKLGPSPLSQSFSPSDNSSTSASQPLAGSSSSSTLLSPRQHVADGSSTEASGAENTNLDLETTSSESSKESAAFNTVVDPKVSVPVQRDTAVVVSPSSPAAENNGAPKLSGPLIQMNNAVGVSSPAASSMTSTTLLTAPSTRDLSTATSSTTTSTTGHTTSPTPSTTVPTPHVPRAITSAAAEDVPMELDDIPMELTDVPMELDDVPMELTDVDCPPTAFMATNDVGATPPAVASTAFGFAVTESDPKVGVNSAVHTAGLLKASSPVPAARLDSAASSGTANSVTPCFVPATYTAAEGIATQRSVVDAPLIVPAAPVLFDTPATASSAGGGLDSAASSGTTKLVATPHSRPTPSVAAQGITMRDSAADTSPQLLATTGVARSLLAAPSSLNTSPMASSAVGGLDSTASPGATNLEAAPRPVPTPSAAAQGVTMRDGAADTSQQPLATTGAAQSLLAAPPSLSTSPMASSAVGGLDSTASPGATNLEVAPRPVPAPSAAAAAEGITTQRSAVDMPFLGLATATGVEPRVLAASTAVEGAAVKHSAIKALLVAPAITTGSTAALIMEPPPFPAATIASGATEGLNLAAPPSTSSLGSLRPIQAVYAASATVKGRASTRTTSRTTTRAAAFTVSKKPSKPSANTEATSSAKSFVAQPPVSPSPPPQSPPASLPPSPQGSLRCPTPVRFGGSTMVPNLLDVEGTPAKGRKRKMPQTGKENNLERSPKRPRTAASAPSRKRKAEASEGDRAASKRQRTGGSHPFVVALPKGCAPGSWLAKALQVLTAHNFGPQWRALVVAWLAFEEQYGFEEKRKPFLASAGRPDVVSFWIKRGRSTAWRPDPEDVDVDGSQFNLWWQSLQPAWRVDSGVGLRRDGGGGWDILRCSGVNGMLSVVAALFFWGYDGFDNGPSPAWDAAVADVLYALQMLASGA